MKIVFVKDKDGNIIGNFSGYDRAHVDGNRLIKQHDTDNKSKAAFVDENSNLRRKITES